MIPTAFDRVLSQRLGEMAFDRLVEKIRTSDHIFETVGIRNKNLNLIPFRRINEIPAITCTYPTTLEEEIEECFEQVSIISDLCVGLGGDIVWTDTSRSDAWEGSWICSKCGSAQEISFEPHELQCVRCKKTGCNNFGYIRNSRKF